MIHVRQASCAAECGRRFSMSSPSTEAFLPVFYFRPESFLRSAVRLGPVEILWPLKNRHTISPRDIASAALPGAFCACICCRRKTPPARISVSFMIKFLLKKQAFLCAYRTKTIPIGRTDFDPGRIRTCSQSTGSKADLPSGSSRIPKHRPPTLKISRTPIKEQSLLRHTLR